MPLAVPGTVVSSGSGVGPGGDFGAQGPAGNVGNEDVGSVKAWPSVTPPNGWLICDGSGQNSTLYPQLYALIGTTFGPGNGTTTNFQLPNLLGRCILGQGQSTAPGNTNHALGVLGGEEKHTLVTAELAAHNHSASSSSSVGDGGHAHTYNYTQFGAGGAVYAGGQQIIATTPTATSTVGTGIGVSTSTSIANAGSNTPHNTLPPFLVLVYIIKVSPTGGPTAQAPLADTSQPGLINKISGLVSDYITGTNQCMPLPFVTRTNVAFTLPALGGTVNVSVNNAGWMAPGMVLNLFAGTSLQQVQIKSISGNTLTVTNYAGPNTGVIASGSMLTYGTFAVAGINQPGIVNALSGAATDYLGGDNLCHPLPPGVGPTSDYYDKDDLIAASSAPVSTKLLLVTNSGASGAVSGFYNVNVPGHPGVAQLAPGTTTGAWSRAYMGWPFAAFDGNMTLTLGGVMMVPSGSFSGPNQYFFGVATSPGPTINTTNSYAGFLGIASSNANWYFYTRNLAVANTMTPTSYPVASIWHYFSIVITGAAPATVQFYIDNDLVGTVADNSVPVATAMMYVGFWTNNSTGVSNFSLLVDAFDILVQPGGPQRFMR